MLTRWWRKVAIPYSFELFFSRNRGWWVNFLRIIFEYFGIESVMSWYFFSCGRWDLQALGRFQLRRIYFWIFGIITEIRFRDLELWMKCLVKSMEFDLRGVIHFCRSNALWGRLPCRQAIRSYFWHVSSAHDWPSCTAFVTFYIFVNTRVSSSIV